MSLICKREESKHYNYQCAKGYTGLDKEMIRRYCKDCLREQAAEKE
jgi:hypothetical protein